jgi:hypothetical protein
MQEAAIDKAHFQSSFFLGFLTAEKRKAVPYVQYTTAD